MSDFSLGRDALKDYFGPEVLCLGDYKKLFANNIGSLKAIDRTLSVDLCFLENHVERLLVSHTQARCLATLPTDEVAKTYSEVHRSLVNCTPANCWERPEQITAYYFCTFV